MSEQEQNTTTSIFINKLRQLEPGERAQLKRSAGETLANSRQVMGLFYRLLPYGVSTFQEEMFFLVATLFPFTEECSAGDFGASLRRARVDEKNSKGLDKRVENLLDADMGQLPFRLRRSVQFLHSQRIRVNWIGLLDDLLWWSHPDRKVQQRWARSYFSK
jgi:CRISPR system Cascade subunit CasB